MPNDITAPKVKETCNPCIECNKITFEDLKKHNDPSNPWIGIKGYVYDVTKFLKDVFLSYFIITIFNTSILILKI